MAFWAGAGDLSALDVQRSRLWLCFMVMLYGCKVLCPTGISQKPWVGRTGVVTVVKRMVMTVEAHCTEPSLVPGSMLKISRGFPTALGSRNLFLCLGKLKLRDAESGAHGNTAEKAELAFELRSLPSWGLTSAFYGCSS